MPERLPVPGEDAETWGTLLNAWLLVEHNEDGTHGTPPAAGILVETAVASGNASVAYSTANAAEQLGAPVSLAGCLGLVCRVADPTGDGVAPWPADGFRVQLISTDSELSVTAVCYEATPVAIVLSVATADELASIKLAQVSDGSNSLFNRTVDFSVALLTVA